MSAVDEAVGQRLPPLRHNRDFMLLWGGAGATLLGARISMFAYPLLVLWYTGSASLAGLVSFAALLPNLLVQLPAGVLVDRWDRRRLMVFSDVGCVLVTASVAVAVFLGRIWLPQLLVAAFVCGSLAVVYGLAERGGVRNLVPAAQLPAALTQNETRSRAAGLLGQPIGAGLFTLLRWMPFLGAALAHLASLVMLLMISKPLQAQRATGPRRLRVELAEGLAWTWRQRLLRTVLALIGGTNVLFQALLLAVMVIIKEEGLPPAVVGLITAVGGVGGALGAFTAIWWRRRLDLRAIVIGTMVFWALLMPSVAVTRNPVTLGVIFAAMAYAGGVITVAGAVYQVQTTPDALQGRVGSVMLLIASGTTAAGALTGGLALDAFGVTRTVLGIGFLMVVLATVSATSPAVRVVADRSLVAPLGRASRRARPEPGPPDIEQL